MQVQKEDVRKSILSAAREEFIKNGFENASVRTITAKAKTSKSNVYNYFKDKDALFYSVVEPTLSGMKAAFDYLAQRSSENESGYTMAAQKEAMSILMEFIFLHEEDFRLLLFKSAGSSLSGFKNKITDSLSGLLYSWIDASYSESGLSEFFIRSIAAFYIGTIEQMLLQGTTRSQATTHLYEFLKFVYGGWSAVLL